MKIEDDTITFDGGLTLYANRGIVGLSPDLRVYEGYDGSLGHGDSFRPAERIELADHMIGLWQQFRAA